MPKKPFISLKTQAFVFIFFLFLFVIFIKLGTDEKFSFFKQEKSSLKNEEENSDRKSSIDKTIRAPSALSKKEYLPLQPEGFPTSKIKSTGNHSRSTEDPYAGKEILHFFETKPDYNGHFLRVKIVKTSFKYSFIRVEEKFRKNLEREEFLGHSAMVADHLIVQLDERYSSSDLSQFLQNLNIKYEIRKNNDISRFYLLSFPIEGDSQVFDQALVELKKLKPIRNVEPDYILRAYAL